MMVFEGKRILLAAPLHFSFNEMLVRELQNVGFDVVDFSSSLGSFRYQSFWQRFHNLQRKLFFGDYENKRKLIAEWNELDLKRRLSEFDQFDYALFVRPDMYPLSFVELVRCKTKIMSAYQWDSISRYPEVDKYLHKFDRFFVFDPKDLIDNRLPLTNFSVTRVGNSYNSNNKEKLQAFFIATYDINRFVKLLSLKQTLEQLGVECRFIVSLARRRKGDIKKIRRSNCELIFNSISYQKCLKYVKVADILIDLVISSHDGLSFRVFEALTYNKKLITTNSQVKYYDFYHPDNIFVLTEDNHEELRKFIHSPMYEVPIKIRAKYEFENWIKYVLNYGNYKEVGFPEKLLIR